MGRLLTRGFLVQTCQKIIRTKSSVRALSHSKYIVKSPIEDLELPKKGNFINYLFKDINQWLNQEALICSVSGQSYSYSELWDALSRFGGLLKKLGIKKGDTVALLAPNVPTYAIPFLGSMFIGATVSPISSTATPDEILRQIVNSDASVVVSHPLLEAPLTKALESHKKGKTMPLLMLGQSSNPRAINVLQALQDTNIPFADPEDLTGDEIAVLPYSSGTTGPPKGVAQTHHSFAAFHDIITHPYFFSAASETHQDQFMGLAPFYHIYGMCILLSGLIKGMRIVTAPKFDPNTYAKVLEDHKIEWVHLVPPLLSFLVNSPLATVESLRHTKVIIIAAAPVAPTLAHAFKQKLGRDILFQEAYGMTECFVTHQTPILGEKTGTAGQTMPNVICKVIDTETGEALPANKKGEILVKTPGLMQGYYKNPEATAAAIDNEGWLHTGDIGIYDDEGYFKIVDRTKELIKVKGLQVSPSEVEDVLRAHPKVVDVGVTGVTNERLGEAPHAFIIAQESLPADEIHHFLKSRLAPHKQLTGGITMVKSLPKSPTGKLLRKELRKMAQTT